MVRCGGKGEWRIRNQTTIRLSKETKRQIQQLGEQLDLPTVTAVIRYAITQTVTIEAARRTLPDSDFVGFLAEVYRPL